jgi:DNA-binding transcriptional LysR family regulator
MDKLTAMRVFQKVASTLSFTAAGDLLGLVPSSVSRHIDSLEQELGVKLLSRSTRKLSLTEAGLLYQNQLEGLLAELDALHECIAGYGGAPRGRLRVSSPRVFGKRVLMPHMRAFMARYPELQVELSITDQYIDLIESDTDLAIRIGALGDSGLICRALGAYQRVLCASPDYLAQRGSPASPSELAEHACLLYRQAGERVAWNFHGDESQQVEAIEPPATFYSNDSEALWLAALDGMGIALLPGWLVKDDLAAGRLCQVLPGFSHATNLRRNGIHLVYPYNRRQSAKVHAFIDYFLPIVSEGLV